MADELPVRSTGKWTFHLQLAQNLQFRVTSDQAASDYITIEGHDISTLLDYLYDNRDLIYNATHDQERSRLEAMEELNTSNATRLEKRRIERFQYDDDGRERTKISI